MTASLAEPISSGREGEYSQNGRRQYIRTFRVVTDSPQDGQVTVLSAPGLPVRGEAYSTPTGEFDNGARCISRRATVSDQSRKLWIVDCIYDTEFELLEDPFLEPPETDFDSESYFVQLPGVRRSTGYDPLTMDETFAFDSTFTNSAGDHYQYDPDMMRDEVQQGVVTVTRNEVVASFSSAKQRLFLGTINKYAWNGTRPRQVLLRRYAARWCVRRSSSHLIPDIPYWRVMYQFVIRDETWDLQLVDAGPRYKKTASGNPIPFGSNDIPRIGLLRNKNTDPTADFDGQKWVEGNPVSFLRYGRKRQIDFTQLNVFLDLAPANVKLRKR